MIELKNHHMELPIELWQLIIHHYEGYFKAYKTCILVNKIFHKIIKQLCDKLPNKILITFEEFDPGYQPFSDTDFQCGKLWDETYRIWLDQQNDISLPNTEIEITRNDILLLKHIIIPFTNDTYHNCVYAIKMREIISSQYDRLLIQCWYYGNRSYDFGWLYLISLNQ